MNTIVYLIRHADTIDEKGIRKTKETSQMINEKEILSIKGEEDSKRLSKNEELKNIDKGELQNYKTLHAPVGEYFARTMYNIDDSEILNAIRYHTIGRVNMSLFEKIIFLADKIEENTRDKKYSEEIWQILDKNKGETGLDMALFRCFSETIKSLVNRELKICKTTIDVYNELLDKVKNI